MSESSLSGLTSRSSHTGLNAPRNVPSSILPITRISPPGLWSQRIWISIWYSVPEGPTTSGNSSWPILAANSA